MSHLDEGIIHAWLDGALDATQARETEAHVASCTACAAAVAEARGFIAGASRILNALDDVPAGVIPKRPAAAPMAVPVARPRRQWRAAPWVTGIAALLVAAVVLETSKGGRASLDHSPLTESAARLADTGAMQVPALPPAVVSAPREEAQAASPEQVAPAAKTLATSQTARRAMVSRGEAPPASAPAVRAAPGAAVGAASAAAPSAQMAADAEASSPRLRRLAEERPTDNRLTQSVANQAAEPGGLAGCYRIDRTPLATLGSVAGATLAPEAARRSAGRGAAAPAAPAAAVSSSRAEFSAKAEAALFVRLDTSSSRLGFTVRAVSSDSIVGTWSARGDSVRVVLDAGTPHMLAKTSRIECPPPRP
jgi:hypothetical protein